MPGWPSEPEGAHTGRAQGTQRGTARACRSADGGRKHTGMKSTMMSLEPCNEPQMLRWFRKTYPSYRKLPNVVSVGSSTSPRVASVTSSAPPSRNLCLSSVLLHLRRVAGLQGRVQDLEAVDVHRSCRLVGQARRLEVRPKVQLCNSVRTL